MCKSMAVTSGLEQGVGGWFSVPLMKSRETDAALFFTNALT